ncbi:MAG: hypothetical protein D6718_02055 [Acidobacteria bacterium]|nr:MAG: hypothetical protein D6718_02055 [Acidobacteriota bacterium]
MSQELCPDVWLEWPFQAPPPVIHCIVCGRVVAGDGGMPAQPVCPHLDLVWGGGDVQWVREEWRPMVEEIVMKRQEAALARLEGRFDDEEELPDPIAAVVDADPGLEPLVISCHTSGIACGPVEDTLVVVLRPTRGAYDRLPR